MGEFDQSRWKAETTWEGELPGPGDIWALLTSPAMPERVRSATLQEVKGSKVLLAGAIQHAESTGAGPPSIGRKVTASTMERLRTYKASGADWKIRFANLVSGRFTELVFARAYSDHLKTVGLELIEQTVDRSFLDFRILGSAPLSFNLPINVKNAGTQMREAQRFFGLDPADTLPMATYKAFGATLALTDPLIYVFLADWELIGRLRECYWTQGLTDAERRAFRLLTSTKEIPRNLEDAFIEATVGDSLEGLLKCVGYSSFESLPFRAISAAKCQRIFYQDHSRSPYVYRQKVNTDPNVHISIKRDTIAFTDLIKRHLSSPVERAKLLSELNKTTVMEVPDSSI